MIGETITAIARAALYEVFASCYLQLPTIETIGKISELLKEASAIFPEIDFQDLIKEADTRQMMVKEDTSKIEALQQQYYDHFFVASAPCYIPPFESSVRGIKKEKNKKGKLTWKYNSLWGNTTYDTAACYETVGFQPQKLNVYEALKKCKVPDHIGYELAFMAYLCDYEGKETLKMQEALEEEITLLEKNAKGWNSLQKQFLEGHLSQFIDSYYEVAEEKASPYYLALIKVVQTFIQRDLADRLN